MRGFYITGPGIGGMRDGPRPVPGIGQALIKMHYAGICGGDPGILALNLYSGTPEQPRVLGHEFCGEVVEIHNPENRPTRVKLGDFVVGPQNRPCMVCDECMEGRFSICTGAYGSYSRPTGCYAEYFERDLDKLFPIDSSVDPLIAALAEPLAISVFDIRNSGAGLGDTVLVIGAGAIGIMIGLLARLNGASDVIFSEISERRIAFIKSLGFDAYHSVTGDVAQRVQEKTGGKGVDYVFEVSGSQSGWDLALSAVRQSGTVAAVGLPGKERAVDFNSITEKEINLPMLNMHHLGDFSEAVNLIHRGDINKELRRLVTSVWPLESAEEAVKASTDKAGGDIKILLQPGLQEKIILPVA